MDGDTINELCTFLQREPRISQTLSHTPQHWEEKRGGLAGKEVWGGPAAEGRGIRWPGYTSDDPQASDAPQSPSEYCKASGDRT